MKIRFRQRPTRIPGGTARDGAGRLVGALTVTSLSAPTTIDLAATRFLAGTAVTTLSSGIPLEPGQLTAAQLGNVSLWRSGSEVACYVEALEGTHPDGSLRAVLVQAVSPSSLVQDVSESGWQLRCAQAPALARISKVTAPVASQYDALPDGVLLPTSPAHLCATTVAGTLAPASADTVTGDWAWWRDKLLEDAPAYFTNNYVANQTFNTTAAYDYYLQLYSLWCRTGNVTYWKHATLFTRGWITRNVQPWPGGQQGIIFLEYFRFNESYAIYYHTTGNVDGRHAVRAILNVAVGLIVNDAGWSSGKAGNDRMIGWAIQCMTTGVKVNATGVASPTAGGNPADYTLGNNWATSLNQRLTLYGTAPYSTDGALGFWDPDLPFRGTKWYMSAIVATGLIRYYEEVSADERIPTIIQKWLDALWPSYVDATTLVGGQPYCNVGPRSLVGNATFEDCGTTVGNADTSLNPFYVYAHVWYGKRFGTPTYVARGLTMIEDLKVQFTYWNGAAPFGVGSGKFSDERYWYCCQTLALLES